MKRRATCLETTREWKRLLSIAQFTTLADPLRPSQDEEKEPTVNDDKDNHATDHDEEDPFDCSSVALPPPTFQLVEQAVDKYLKVWKQLDQRKIVQEQSSDYRQVRFQDGTTTFRKRHGWRLVEDRLRLPPNFDYATIGPEPPDNVTTTTNGEKDDDGLEEARLAPGAAEERVIMLNAPNGTASYHRELWRLFASIPTAQQLEDEARQGAQLPHSLALHQELQTLLQKEPDAPDSYLLLRLRMAHRHGLPPPPSTSTTRPISNRINHNYTATIRFECWRRQPKRQPSPDPYRMVVEFRADQTLYDVHVTLMGLAEDDLWDNGAESCSGCFFIEDSFYIYGNIDYAQPILDWMDAGNGGQPHAARRGYLGITTMEPLPRRLMQETKLEDIPMRLGIRYYHACHGDVEIALCMVDRRLTCCPQGSTTTTTTTPVFPIIHDLWTPQFNVPLCDACQTCTAAFVASIVLHPQRHLLCEICRRLLKIPPESLQLYSSWRDEPILSTSLAVQTKRLF